MSRTRRVKKTGVILLLVMAFLFSVPFSTGAWGGTFTNPIVPRDTPDPSIVYHNGFYYLTFTHDGADVVLWKSRTLDFRNATKKTVWTPPSGTMYSEHIWAPELQFLNNQWYIYFAASDSNMDNHRMYALQANSMDPMGEWSFKGKITDSTDKWAIDGITMQKGDSLYFIWSGWEGDTNVRQNLYIAPMSDPLTISGDRVEISRPTYDWEKVGDPDVNEAPELLHRNGRYFLIYSASGSWTPDYKLGMLTIDESVNPLVSSNWVKNSTPVFERNDANGVYGPGHNTFTISPDGKEDWIIYHATDDVNDGWNDRTARAQRFFWNSDGTPNFGVPQALSTPMDIPSAVGKFEAEYAIINHAEVGYNDSASNDYKVGYIDYSDSWVEWRDVNVPTAGTYRLQVRFANGSGKNATHNVTVNGNLSGAITYPHTGWSNWGTVSMDVRLNAGSNTIRLSKGDNYAELDYIDVTRFEAEYAGINKAKVGPSDTASNRQKVGYIDYPDSWVEIRNIQVPEDGTYTIRVRFANGSGTDATHWVSVNGGAGTELVYPHTGWSNWSSVTMTVNLHAGNNYIRLTKGANYAELDYVEVYK